MNTAKIEIKLDDVPARMPLEEYEKQSKQMDSTARAAGLEIVLSIVFLAAPFFVKDLDPADFGFLFWLGIFFGLAGLILFCIGFFSLIALVGEPERLDRWRQEADDDELATLHRLANSYPCVRRWASRALADGGCPSVAAISVITSRVEEYEQISKREKMLGDLRHPPASRAEEYEKIIKHGKNAGRSSPPSAE